MKSNGRSLKNQVNVDGGLLSHKEHCILISRSLGVTSFLVKEDLNFGGPVGVIILHPEEVLFYFTAVVIPL